MNLLHLCFGYVAVLLVVELEVMDWVVDLSQKIGTLLDAEGLMALQEDAFDYVEHQLQTVGNSIENQFQTVSANIENQLQAIHANIEQYCSGFELGGSESVDMENKNFEPTALKSSEYQLDLLGDELSELADAESENINIPAQECSLLLTESKTLKSSACPLDLFGDEISDLGDEENENINITAQECSLLLTEPKTLKHLPLSMDLFAETASETDISIPHSYSEESRDQKFGQYVKWTYPKDLKHGSVVRPKDKEQRLDEICSEVDNDNLCSLCLKKFKCGSNKKITCEACAVKLKLINHQECEHPAPESEVLYKELNQSEDESFETADFECDSDWEIV